MQNIFMEPTLNTFVPFILPMIPKAAWEISQKLGLEYASGESPFEGSHLVHLTTIRNECSGTEPLCEGKHLYVVLTVNKISSKQQSTSVPLG